MDKCSGKENNISSDDILKALDRFGNGSKTPSPVGEDRGRYRKSRFELVSFVVSDDNFPLCLYVIKNNIVHFFSGISLKMCEGKLDQDLRSTRCLQSVTMLLHVICVMSFTLLKLRYKWIVDLDLFSLRIEIYFRQLSSRNYQFFLLCATL